MKNKREIKGINNLYIKGFKSLDYRLLVEKDLPVIMLLTNYF